MIDMTPEEFLAWARHKPFGAPFPKTQTVEFLVPLLGVSRTNIFTWFSGKVNPSKTSLLLMEALKRENRIRLAERAEDFARHKHEGQTRKYTNDPYANHPETVVRLLSEYTDDERLLAAAWLHDTMEDCGVSYGELCAEFGPYVATLVYLLTNDEEEKERLGKARYMSKKLAALPPDALTIKLCDMLDNMTGTRSRRQAETYVEILRRVREKKPAVWNGTHEELAERILETYGQKVF